MRSTIRTEILAMAVACCASAYAQTLTGTARILDADTILIGSERIRLQGVDAPRPIKSVSIAGVRFGIAGSTRATN
jgi:endonuclease YncB( thermonuclease family)